MRLGRAGRYALLTLSLGLGACSWLPWHKKRPAMEGVATAPVSVVAPQPQPATTSASAPASATANPADAPSAASGTSVAGADVAAQLAPVASRPDGRASGQYAPLSESEWRDLFDRYQQLAQCEDRYMNSAGLNSADVAQRLVLMNKAGALRADALRLLDAKSPLHAQWTAAAATQPDQQVVLINQTLMALMGDADPQTGLGRTLARKAVARSYVSLVTGKVCPVDPKYQVLMRKAAS